MVFSASVAYFIIIFAFVGPTLAIIWFLSKRNVALKFYFFALVPGAITSICMMTSKFHVYEFTRENKLVKLISIGNWEYTATDGKKIKLEKPEAGGCIVINSSDTVLAMEYCDFGNPVYTLPEQINLVYGHFSDDFPADPDYFPDENPRPATSAAFMDLNYNFTIKSWLKVADKADMNGAE